MNRPETHQTQLHLMRACDVVFGSASILLALVGTWAAVHDRSTIGFSLALWLVPGFNLAWSFASKGLDRASADLVRGVVCLPLAAYIYHAQPSGFLAELWLPGFMMSVAVCMSAGIGTRKLRASAIMATAAAVTILISGRSLDVSLHDALGVWLGDILLSIVGVHLGRALEDLAEQRDEARAQMQRRLQLEVELAHAQKLESVGRLAAGVAHEINTPVQFVGDSLRFVREGVGDLIERVGVHPDDEDLAYLVDQLPQALDRAEDGLGRVARIVRSMKVFAHPDTDTMVPTDLNRAVEATVVLAHNEYRFVADVELELDPRLPAVECYAGELNQAVLNIVVNAAHAIGDRGGERGHIHVRTYQDTGNAVISIRDTGTGIPDSVRDRIFDPFFTTKEVGRGTGQGLAIAHSVVEKHGGRLWFDSELGRGTTFYLQLPIERAALAAAA